MRHRIETRNGPLLARSERSRLLMLIVMLLLVGSLMYRARDPRMWKMFGGDAEGAKLIETTKAPEPQAKPQTSRLTPRTSSLQPPASSNAGPPEVPPIIAGPPAAGDTPAEAPVAKAPDEAQPSPSAQTPIPESSLPELPPLDEDSEERSALTEEMTAVADKTFNQPEEMFAYYRLLRWAMSQSAEQLHNKAIQDPRYGDVFLRPQFYRGKLVEFQLRVRRVLEHKDLEKDNLAGVDHVWELVGYNDTSGQNFYMCITDELPDKMSYGDNVVEDGRFVGYFFKLMRYEDRAGTNRAIPLFIGKFIWDPPISQMVSPETQMREAYWVLGAAALIGVLLLGRWAYRMRHPTPKRARMSDDPALQMLRRRQAMDKGSEEESIDLESWLEQTEHEAEASEINPDAPGDSEEER